MRIVLDTNVLISGIFFGGIPALILDRWTADRFMVYATPSIMTEYVRVISDMAKSEAYRLLSLMWQAMLPEVAISSLTRDGPSESRETVRIINLSSVL